MARAIHALLLPALLRIASALAPPNVPSSGVAAAPAITPDPPTTVDRRAALTFLVATTPPLFLGGNAPRPALAFDDNGNDNDRGDAKSLASILSSPPSRAITIVRLDTPRNYAGLELYDLTIGTPPRQVVAVRSVRPDGEGAKSNVQPGMIVLGYPDARSVVKRIQGEYPIELRLYNLAAGGDAIGAEGRPIVSAQDALDMAKRASGGGSVAPVKPGRSFGQKLGDDDDTGKNAPGFVIDVVKKAKGKCAIQSRRGDVLEVQYEARIGDKNGRVYDSSLQRGTGQPYMFNLGNGDVIRGVDLGTYDMCPGEVRELTLPPELGYGAKGSKLFRVPPNSKLWWRIELVELNYITEGRNDAERDELYEGLTNPP